MEKTLARSHIRIRHMPLGIKRRRQLADSDATEPFAQWIPTCNEEIFVRGGCSNSGALGECSLQLNLRSQRSHHRRSLDNIFSSNLRHARIIWGELRTSAMRSLRDLSHAHALSVTAGKYDSWTVGGM